MKAVLRPVAEIDESGQGRWRELAEQAAEPNPFFEAELVVPAEGTVASGAQVLVAQDDAGDWAGALPVRRAIRWRECPLPSRSAWRHLYCFLGTPLVRAGAEDEVMEAWLGRGGPSRRPYLGFDRIGSDGPVAAALERAAQAAGTPVFRYEDFERATLERGRDGPYLGVNTKHRRELDRQWRRLSEMAGSEPVIRDRAGEAEAVEDFMRIEASGWKGREGTAFACDDAHAEYFRRICASLAEAGRLELLALETAEGTIAMKCNIRAGAGVFAFKIGYDEDYAQFSPGIQLERYTIEHLDEAPPEVKWVDTCADPDNRMSKRVWPDRRAIAALAVPAPGPSGALGRAALRAGLKVNERRKGTDDKHS